MTHPLMKLALVCLLPVACGGQPSPSQQRAIPSPEGPVAAGVTAQHATIELPHWAYAGPEGPTHWGSLHPDYAACTVGQAQSPIDLPTVRSQPLTRVQFNYTRTPLSVVNNGHTIQINNAGSNDIHLDATTYRLVQFHFHAPSEHTVSGRRFALEMHLVHEDERGRLAVVAVFMNEGVRNTALDEIWNRLPASAGHEISDSTVTIDLRALLPPDLPFSRYSGSLTTPPCTEGVKWIILGVPVTLDDLQVAAFRAIMHDNNRPLQPLNDRAVRRREPEM